MASKVVQLTDELKKAIGQHFVVGFHGPTLSQDILTLTSAPFYVGNVIIMKRNVTGAGEGFEGGRAQELKEMIDTLQKHAKDAGQEQGLGIGTDQEGGLVSAFSTDNVVTQFPGAMTLASISDSGSSTSIEMTKKVYAAQARELSLLGVNWAYAPVGDVNSDRRNPVIGVRSFGDNAAKVAQYVSSACEGLIAEGVAPSIKHFPGHGDTYVDSHLDLPRIRKHLEEMERTELVPWVDAFKGSSELLTVMTGHMSLPLLTGHEDEPASLSKVVTTDLLRKKLRFNGLVVTDCLEMDAIARTKSVSSNPPQGDEERAEKWNGGPGIEEGAVLALEAGADVVMICHTFEKQVAAIQRAWEAVESGRVSLDDLRISNERVKRWKRSVGLCWDTERLDRTWDQKKWLQVKEESAKVSAEAYARAIVQMRPGKMLTNLQHVVVYTPAMETYNKAVDDAEGVLRTQGGAIRNTAGASFLAFVRYISKRVPSCSHVVYSKNEPDDMHPKSEVADGRDIQVIFVLRNADRSKWQIDALRKVLKNISNVVVVVSSSTPYDLMEFSDSETYAHLACGEYTAQALEEVTSVIFGEKIAEGQLAVAV